MRPESDVDPRKLNVEPRKRRRKDRKRPDPPQANKEAEERSLDRVRSMPISPGVMAEPTPGGWRTVAPHNDPGLWEVQLAEAFGTRSASLARTFLAQLRKLCAEDWDDDLGRWKFDETEWNALLALVADHEPQNATQAALAAQMAAVHMLTMRLASEAFNRGHTTMDREAGLTSKLARTFAQQCETMAILKGGKRTSRQAISVVRESHHHQHIHVHREGGSEENGSQSDAKAIEGTARRVEDLCEVSGRDESGQVVPFASRGG